MEITTQEYKWKEILVDGIPIGCILLDNDNKIHMIEIYDDHFHSKWDWQLFVKFCSEIQKYDWIKEDDE